MRLLLLVVLLSTLQLAACTQINPNSQCSPVPQTSIFQFDDSTVYLYGANDDSTPEIWEGPVCIARNKRSVCELDLSLIKGVEHGAKGLQLRVFSGSNEQVLEVDVKRCLVE